MTELYDLLPPSISGDEAMAAAAEAAGSEDERIAGLIDNVLLWARLDAQPEEILDHIGWGLHIDGWEYATTRELKIWLIRNFYDWHAYKGTVYGLAMYWRVLLGRELLAASPPHKFFWGVSITDEQRAAFQAPHPEIRVYPFKHGGTRAGWIWGQSFMGADHWLQTDAILRIGAAVEQYDPLTGQSMPLHSLQYDTTHAEKLARAETEVRLPGRAAGIFPGASTFAGFWVDHGAAARLYTLDLAQPYTDQTTLRRPMVTTPGLGPLTIKYTPGAVPGRAVGTFPANRWPDEFQDVGGKCFWGAGQFWVDHEAGDRIYKSVKLFDPARVSFAEKEAAFFWGACRFGGIPAHTAEVAVDMAGRAPKRAAYWGPSMFWGTSALATSDAALRIAQVRGVGKMAKRLSDKIELSITNRKQVRASSGVLAGTVKAGEYRLEVL